MNTIREMLFDVSNAGSIIILVIILIMLYLAYMIKQDNTRYDDKFPIWNRILLIILIVIVVVAIGIRTIAAYKIINIQYNYQEEKPADTIEYLVGLNDNMGVRGKYYITRGFIESDMYYNYMVDCGSYMRQNQLNAITNDIRIITSSTEKPRIEWRTKRRTYGPFYEEDKYWNIYVPEGTINDTISIDMK